MTVCMCVAYIYTMVADISHDIAFGMCHARCNGKPHDYVVCFWPHGMLI